MVEGNLNDEVIKIFIESWLVKYENFILKQHFVEKSFNDYRVAFRVNDRQLELYAIDDHKVIEKVQILDIDTNKCIAFAMEAYLVFHKTICELKKSH